MKDNLPRISVPANIAGPLHERTITAFLLKIKEQPKGDGLMFYEGAYYSIIKDLYGSIKEVFVPPLIPGQKFRICEPWQYGYDTYIYYADSPELHLDWKSSASMPNEACRTILTCKVCKLVGVRDMSTEENIKCGFGKDDSWLMQTVKFKFFKEDKRFGRSTWERNDYVFYVEIE